MENNVYIKISFIPLARVSKNVITPSAASQKYAFVGRLFDPRKWFIHEFKFTLILDPSVKTVEQIM